MRSSTILSKEHYHYVGYQFLVEKYQLSTLPHWHTSICQGGTFRKTVQDAQEQSIYPLSYWPGDSIGAQLEFALKYDGINLGILAALFDVIPEDELIFWIKSKPTGKYTRRIWALYEFITGKELPLAALDKGKHINLLDPEAYYTCAPGKRMSRQRVFNNLLGDKYFCPIVRRTEKLKVMESIDLHEQCKKLTQDYSPELLSRALSYLYYKETKSSFLIEHIEPDVSRTEKFIGLLKMAEHKDFCEKSLLIDAQNLIVDPRFLDIDYRITQNYVGESISFRRQRVHYICPKPEDLQDLMNGLFQSHALMMQSDVPAIVHAAIIAYAFVFMHPFEDGNGRIHRFLIHNILSLRQATPKGLMFPVSAAILNNMELYDISLEAFSSLLMPNIKYNLDELGQMAVIGLTKNYYSYIDMTVQSEALYEFVELTIKKELVEELDFIASYDKVKKAIQQIIDMPDKLIDLFIKFCLQNDGKLSSSKREKYFSFLVDQELKAMEQAVKNEYKIQNK